MVNALSHVSLVVPNLESASERVRQLFGLSVGPVMVNAQQGVRMVYIELGNARLELMEPQPSNPALMRFLEKHPQGGLHHVSFEVDSVAQVCADLQAQGVSSQNESTLSTGTVIQLALHVALPAPTRRPKNHADE